MSSGFYDDVKFCAECREYVPYLRAPERSFCAWCGAEVHLFSRGDLATFRASISRERQQWLVRPFEEPEDERESA